MKRSLILAGGGVKVAFQAGVLQVWLDEAGLEFDHADGASGGCFNLAMYAQGMTGTQIADAWRNVDPLLGVDIHWSELVKLAWAESLFELERYRRNVFPAWGLDWDRIRAGTRASTFNVYNFSKQELRVVEQKDMTEDLLVASVSLPMWFPPVRIDGDTYIDSVFNTDANLEEAIRRGADELWVIWTVSRRGEWQDGFIGNYFGIIEAAANGRYNQLVARIHENNRSIGEGGAGEFGRKIVLRELAAEVPMHYLVNFSQDRVGEAVNRGVAAAREWCQREGIPLRASAAQTPPTSIHKAPTKLRFTEDMKGYVAAGETDPRRGYDAGRDANGTTHCRMTVVVDNVSRFVADPDHDAAIEGWVTSPFGEQRPIERGEFNLFVDSGDPSKKKMLYRLQFTGVSGEKLTLSGFKDLHDDEGFDLWADSTTLFVKIYAGHVDAAGEGAAQVRAAGIIRIGMLDFAKQLASFRTEGPTLADRTSALADFGKFFLGRLWDVYARQVLTYAPF
jgi:predicted acylesterase/phospholipase RssA